MSSNTNISELLQMFDNITLQEMDNVKLQDRVDTKFVFNASLLAEVLTQLKDNYRLLAINNNYYNTYESLYFDTPDLKLYHLHQNQKLNRHKIRFRRYVESNLHYLEIKYKSNKGRTIKYRQKTTEIDTELQLERNKLFCNKHLPFTTNDLKPTIWVNYKRLTFVNKHSPERLTIDTALTFIANDQTITLSPLVICELKQTKANSQSIFCKQMKTLHVRPGSISKYCLAIIYTHEGIKQNTFKPQLRILKKTMHATS